MAVPYTLFTFLVCFLTLSVKAGETPFLFLGQDIAPYFFVNDKNEIVGLYPEILGAACQELNETCSFEIYPINRMLKILESGSAHGTAPFLKIPEREPLYYFSEFNIPSYYVFYGRTDLINRIRNLSDFGKEDISVHNSSGAEAELNKLSASCSYCLKIKREPTFKNVVERLINDKHPLVYINSHIANYYIHDRKLENVKGSSLLRTSMTYRIAFSKKSMNERTFHRFDRKLLELEKKGVIKKILQKYGL